MHHTPSASARAVMRPAPNPAAALRLFCFPYAGGGASAYHAWARLLPAVVELGALQLPGRETRRSELPYTSFDETVTGLVAAIDGLLDKPFVFFGHSLGALLAFETARRLRAEGKPQPQHLLLSSRRPPQLPEPFGPVAGLPEAEFVAEIRRRYDGIPQVILQEPELMALFLPTLRADFGVLESHVYTEELPLAAPITVFGGSEDPVVTAAALSQWRQHTADAFAQQQFPGGHFYLQAQRAALVDAVSARLQPHLVGV